MNKDIKNREVIMDMLHDLLGAELCINGKGAEVSAILGVGYEVSFFDVRQGRIYMDADEVRKFLVKRE